MPRNRTLQPFRTGHRGLEGPFFVYFETNGSSDADGIVDGSGILTQVSGATQVDHAATGRYTLTLDDTFRVVYAVAWLEETGTNVAQVSARTGSTVQVSTLNSSLAEADLTDKTVGVMIYGQSDSVL